MLRKPKIKANKLDFNFATGNEICEELGQRLKTQRLSKNMKQTELATRAGVAVATIKNLESQGQCSLGTLVKIVRALDLIQELSPLFEFKVQSIAQMELLEKLTASKIPRRAR